MTSTVTICTSPLETAASTLPAVGCCGGPAPQGTQACCVRDADVKAAGGAGCGCGTLVSTPATPGRVRSGCC